MKKNRLDVLLVERNIFPSREQAQSAIMAGEIFVDELKVTKAGAQVSDNAIIRHAGKLLPYVSRGGLKLQKAINAFNLDFENKVYFDIGASTGGFTDCALQHGARKVYAIDVGYGQLAWSLRNNPNVIVMERTNARSLTAEFFADRADIISLDLSFISVTKVIPVLLPLLNLDAQIIILVKPQFEAGKEKVGKKGVVKDPLVHREVIQKVIKVSVENKLVPVGLTYSPIKGPKGNIEFLLLLNKKGGKQLTDKVIEDVIIESQQLNT